MKATLHSRMLWQIRRRISSLGWPGLLSLCLSLVGVLAYWQAIAPLQQRIAEVRLDTETLRTKVAQRRATLNTSDPQAQLAEFYAFFPDEKALTDTVERLQVAALAESLLLDQGEYRLVKASVGALSRYDITLPVKASYPSIRRFIARALRENPSLALEAISFRRAAAASIGTDARIQLTLYLRGGE